MIKNIMVFQAILLSILIVSCSQANQTEQPNIKYTETARSKVKNSPSAGEFFIDTALSSDGTDLAIYTNTSVYIYDTTTNVLITIEQINDTQVKHGAIAYKPNSEIIAISGSDTGTPIKLINARTKKVEGGVFDLPNGFYVTSLKFSKNGNFLFASSEYSGSPESKDNCAHYEPLTNFSIFYIKPGLNSFEYSKIFDKTNCVVSSIYTQAHFTEDDKLFIYTEASAYLIELTSSQAKEQVFDKQPIPYDISNDGKILAVVDTDSSDRKRITKLIDIDSGSTLKVIPYMVKILENDTFLVRDDIRQNLNWGLSKNGKIICSYDKLVYPFHFIWEMNTTSDFFISYIQDVQYVQILLWDINKCLVKNQLKIEKSGN